MPAGAESLFRNRHHNRLGHRNIVRGSGVVGQRDLERLVIETRQVEGRERRLDGLAPPRRLVLLRAQVGDEGTRSGLIGMHHRAVAETVVDEIVDAEPIGPRVLEKGEQYSRRVARTRDGVFGRVGQ